MNKVFALFRNPATYIDPLLQNFSKKVDLLVAFSVNKPHKENSLKGVNHVFLKNADVEKFREGKDYEIVQKDVKRYMSEKQFDFVFLATSYWSLTTWIALFYAKRKKLPVMTRMTAVVDRKRNVFINAVKKIIVTSYCKRMDAAVYECEEQKNYLIKYGMRESQLFYAPCAVDNDYFSSLYENFPKNRCREELGIEKDSFVIVFTGQLIDRKRPYDLIESVKSLEGEGYKIRLYLLGDGILKDNIEEYISRNKLSKSIIVCGNVDHETMARYLSAGDLYVLPSEYDASPKALNEAMNFELPIIVSDGVKTAKETCKNEVNGYIFETGNINDLTDKIRYLVDKPENIEKMGKCSKEIVSHYSFDAVADAWIKAMSYAMSNRQQLDGVLKR